MILLFILACAPIPTDGSDPRVTRSFPTANGYMVDGIGTFVRFEPEPGIVCYGAKSFSGSGAPTISCVAVPVEPK